MSSVIDCFSTCAPTASPVNVTGPQGQNAFSIVQSDFTVPAVGASVTVTVDSALWMVVGQSVVAGQTIGAVLAGPGPGSFRVASITNATTISLTFLGLPGDVAVGQTISKGAAVSPGNSGVLFQTGTSANMSGTPGTVTVSNVRITTNSRIFVTVNTSGGTPGDLKVTTRNTGALGSFVIASSANETSTVDWLVVG